jgi:tRNA(fMet)-specific endonuclease VapC
VTRTLLDTSAYAAFMRGHEGIKSALQQAEEVYLNAIVIGELLAGFMRGRHRQKNQTELQTFLSSERVGVLTLDQETSARYAVILDTLRNAGTPIPTNDIWIAATAMQHSLRILTTDAHYLKIPQVIVDLFEI